MRNSRTPLTQSTKDALEVLRPAIESADSGVACSTAEDLLVDDGFTSADTNEVVAELLQKGYLYEVDDELRLP
jgi:hypothetical protein